MSSSSAWRDSRRCSTMALLLLTTSLLMFGGHAFSVQPLSALSTARQLSWLQQQQQETTALHSSRTPTQDTRASSSEAPRPPRQVLKLEEPMKLVRRITFDPQQHQQDSRRNNDNNNNNNERRPPRQDARTGGPGT